MLGIRLYNLISVLVPTRGRVTRLAKMIDSFEKTSVGLAELVFRVDEDDEKTLAMLTDYPNVIVGPRKRGYADLPSFFNELYIASKGDVLMCGNDDVVFVTQGWDERILEEANKYPDGIFDFGVNTHNHPNFPLACVSRKMVDRIGFLFDPRFFWGDIFLRDVTSYFGRAIPLHDVQIDHEWIGQEPDRVFMAGEHIRRNASGEFHATAVREAIAKLEAAS